MPDENEQKYFNKKKNKQENVNFNQFKSWVNISIFEENKLIRAFVQIEWKKIN